MQYVEAARKLAERLVREGGATDEERAVLGFRLTTARTPEPEEVAVVLGLVTAERAAYRTRPEAAEALLAEGASPRDATLEATEVAAWTQAACLLLNLDETITKD